MAKNLITISEIVQRYKVPYSTINHYTNIGLLTVVSKTKNARLYDNDQVRERLKNITEFKSKGYPLHLIRKVLFE